MSYLVEHVKRHCDIHKIEFRSTETDGIQYPGHTSDVSGYFVVKNNNPILGIAFGVPASDEILLHEFNHSMQWIENDRAWCQNYLTSVEAKKFDMPLNAEALDVIHGWIDKKIELTEREASEFTNRAINVELDCEKRTTNCAFLFFKDFDKAAYTKKANAYLRSYKFAELHREWNFSIAPYEDDATIASQLSTFDQDYFSQLSPGEIAIYDDLCKRGEQILI